MTASLQVQAPAKVNLLLHLTGKRADGYHLLESLVTFAACGDVLDIAPADLLSLEVAGPYAGALSAPGENLVLKAAMLLQQASGCTQGACMTLHKHLPVGAGLGGGSSDAAAALKGLCELWGIAPALTLLEPLAVQLGADVPVCLHGVTSWVRGIGDVVTPVALGETLFAVLVNPNLALWTADVFRAFSGAFDQPLAAPPVDGAAWMQHGHNALEEPAIRLLPVIGAMLAALRATPGCRLARMSGSGATCFGLYDNLPQAEAAVEQVKQAHPDWWAVATTLGGGHGQTQ